MSIGNILVIAGVAGVIFVLIAAPIAAVLLHKKGQKITLSIREEYEL